MTLVAAFVIAGFFLLFAAYIWDDLRTLAEQEQLDDSQGDEE